MTKQPLPHPLTDDDGGTITDYVAQVDFTATGSGAAAGIPPGEFDMFNLSVGPFPKAPNMTFAALQTYSDGSTVNWDEKAANGAVPDHPAPVAARTVTATLSSAQVAALHLTLRRLTPDGSQWATSAAVVPLPGVWTLTLDVALGPAGAYSTSASYRVW